MGFLNHSTNNIVIDAVLTNKGREAIASTDGLSITKFALTDDEVDYTIIKKYGRIVGKEKIEKNTPIFEASTSADLGLKYFLNDGDGLAIGQQLQSFSLNLITNTNVTATTVTYSTDQNNGTTTFSIQVSPNTSATTLQRIELTGVPEYSFNTAFLSLDSSSSSQATFTIEPAAKTLTQYHNSAGNLVLPITVKNDNGFEQTIFVTIAFA